MRHEKIITGNVLTAERRSNEIRSKKSKTALMAIPTIEFQKCFESWIQALA